MCTNMRQLWILNNQLSKNGKQAYSFSRRVAGYYSPRPRAIMISCGKCVECKMDKARKIGVRCMNETELHQHNAYITLTYDDQHVTENLVYYHLQTFWKRLRQDVKRNPEFYHGSNVRYIACGEYGDISERVHYHAITFGIDFADRDFYKYVVKNGCKYNVYKSKHLSELWSHGFCTVADVNFRVAQYIAGYILKRDKEERYKGHVTPERVFYSTKPAIGLDWWKKYYKNNVYRGYMMCQNDGDYFRCGIPRYYINKLQDIDPAAYQFYIDKFGQPLYYDELLQEPDKYWRKIEQDAARNDYLVYMNNQIVRDLDFDVPENQEFTQYTLSDKFVTS